MITNASRHVKTILFSCLPLLVLLAMGEILIFMTGADKPRLYTKGFIGTEFVRYDPELLWSMCPGSRRVDKRGTVYTINEHGLRSPSLVPKKTTEFRILSLGESSTFGIGVADNETYSALLEQALNQRSPRHRYRVINAGASAYSSTQSVRYLERRGLVLQPDAVLFYHEINDYLPTTIRDLGNNEIGITMTDAQLMSSLPFRINGLLFGLSGIYRFAFLSFVRSRIQSFDWQHFQSPFPGIGLADMPLAVPTILDATTHTPMATGGNVYFRRVSNTERLQNFEKLLALCTSRNIRLVIMHPSYRRTQRHECLLTDFCHRHELPLFETYDILHPSDPGRAAQMFLDEFHPTAEGHRRLAEALADFLAPVACLNHPLSNSAHPR
ncbi:MAG: SGNH/GDSL hydrolase family protein [Desulfobacterota bacterium]|nr:SGNH/GDSL hydrolase family protein [Thermodesulfobacteriota bacterium]